MIEAWRALLFADEDQQAKQHRDPIAPARRSAKAERKALTHTLEDGSPAHSWRTPNSAADAPTFTIVTRPNQTQQRALQMLETVRV